MGSSIRILGWCLHQLASALDLHLLPMDSAHFLWVFGLI
jgi:hypothetical protein